MPLLSFLIPSYNHQDYVCQTLDSVLADTKSGCADFEIVLIDDGSTDCSVGIIRDWQSRHPDVPLTLVVRENLGLCATLNEMISLAQGDVIRLIASDDLIFPGSTQKVLQAFETTLAMAVIGDAPVIDGAGNVVANSGIEFNGGRKDAMNTPEGLRHEIVANWSIPGPCLAVRRSVYGMVGKYSEDLRVEDWDFYLRLVANDLAVFVDTPVACYRIHTSNASRTHQASRRIAALSSQVAAAEKRMGWFKGHERKLLQRERLLLQLKIRYLERDFLHMPAAMLRYAVVDLGIRLHSGRTSTDAAARSPS